MRANSVVVKQHGLSKHKEGMEQSFVNQSASGVYWNDSAADLCLRPLSILSVMLCAAACI